VTEFIELPWDERMLAYHEGAGERLAEFGDLPSVGGKPARPGEERLAAHAKTREPPDPERLARWKQEMKPADRAAFERVAGDLLAELGYEVARGAAIRRKLGRLVAPLRRRLRRKVGESGANPAAADARASERPSRGRQVR
jgi:hypothetical protein